MYNRFLRATVVVALTLSTAQLSLPAIADAGHGDSDHGHEQSGGSTMMGEHINGHMEMMQKAMEEHGGHEHGHDFEAIEQMSPEQRDRMLALMREVGVAMPPMDPERGRQIFLEKGCVACHSVNGVGGDLGPALDAKDMPQPMNAFEFAARMWRGARAMTELQEDLLGDVISLDGQDLADLIAFAHSEEEQAHLTVNQVPPEFRELIAN